jgi:hypothetical protein
MEVQSRKNKEIGTVYSYELPALSGISLQWRCFQLIGFTFSLLNFWVENHQTRPSDDFRWEIRQLISYTLPSFGSCHLSFDAS